MKIGTKVKLNDGVAPAFIGQTGTIIDTRESVINGHLYVVELDAPTAPATNWSPCATLAVDAKCLEVV